MEKKKCLIINVVLILVAIIFTVLVKVVDVNVVNGTDLGFSTINTKVFDMLGTSDLCYKLTEVLGVLAILVAGCYGLLGAYQLFKRKSLFKVDKPLLALGGLYAVVVVVYVLFEKVVINYRPILEAGATEYEASYPSSHTLLALCILGSAVIFNNIKFTKDIVKKINIGLIIMMVVIVVGRLLAGVHWFTDIIGGVLISCALLMTYYTSLQFLKDKDE